MRLIADRIELFDLIRNVLYPGGIVREVRLLGVYPYSLSLIPSAPVVPDNYRSMDPESNRHAIDIVWFCYIHPACEIHKEKKTIHQLYPIQFHQTCTIMNSYMAAEGQDYIIHQNNKTASEFTFKKDLAVLEVCFKGGQGQDCPSSGCPLHAR